MCTYPPSKYIWAVIIATSLYIANYPTFLEDTMIWSVFLSLKNCYHDNWYLVFQIILTNSRLKAENMKKKLRWFQKLSYLKQRDKIVSQTRFLHHAKICGKKYDPSPSNCAYLYILPLRYCPHNWGETIFEFTFSFLSAKEQMSHDIFSIFMWYISYRICKM